MRTVDKPHCLAHMATLQERLMPGFELPESVVSSHWRRRPGGGTGRAAHSVALSACALRDRRLGYCSRGADPAPGRASAGSGAVRLFFAGIAIASVYGGRGPVCWPLCLRRQQATTSSFGHSANCALHGSALIATCLSLRLLGVVVAIFCGALASPWMKPTPRPQRCAGRPGSCAGRPSSPARHVGS